MRVIAGKFRSRQLATLAGDNTRPTYDRLRETLFNILQPRFVDDNLRFLDLFAGSGAIGVEALSRSAARVVFVERDRRAAAVIRKNLAAVGLQSSPLGACELLERAVSSALALLEKNSVAFDVVFLDPPYADAEAYAQTLGAVARSRSLLAPEAIVIAEHERYYDPGEAFADLRRYRLLQQGNSCLSFYRRAAAPEPEPAAEADAAACAAE